ncbi:hypothetical protein B2J93_2639 [Marssonina coronariae]|uniref:Glycosyl transferase family 1 domain-containing protein n=1 Tax=Diplocarpon coronariae TaxID=2795749 RepID=A0A218Z7W6_9HELO|nr:hypothetical protein B2J93_2639 [Marssonina coronariae]
MARQIQSKKSINLALVCGDGAPISGLLTTFRNVIDLISNSPNCPELISLPIATDLGYSWRPDKVAFFPRGPKETLYPSWLSVTDTTPVSYPEYGEELLRIRREVSQSEELTPEQRKLLHERIGAISAPYQQYFETWFEEKKIDWVCAVNMTLSDAVPVTNALHRAAEKRWGKGRPGGVLFWDHDLMKSCAVHEKNERVYPIRPNEFTPVPQAVPWHTWAVVSDVLFPETLLYPTELRASVVPNVLPILQKSDTEVRDQDLFSRFLSDFEILDGVNNGRPILLCPNRIFPVKGIEISIQVLAAIKSASMQRDLTQPYLLIFGDLEEDPEYAAELQALVRDAGLTDDIRFLGGVPLCSGIKGSKVVLDEKDLLCLAAASHGGVIYTPNTKDVESVGLGPALASIAGIPCVVSEFNALRQVYGDDLHCVLLDNISRESFDVAAKLLVNLMKISRLGSEDDSQRETWSKMVEHNKSLMLKKFPQRPWKGLLLRLARQGGIDEDVALQAQAALGLPGGISRI